jgi:hypothetical protein
MAALTKLETSPTIAENRKRVENCLPDIVNHLSLGEIKKRDLMGGMEGVGEIRRLNDTFRKEWGSLRGRYYDALVMSRVGQEFGSEDFYERLETIDKEAKKEYAWLHFLSPQEAFQIFEGGGLPQLGGLPTRNASPNLDELPHLKELFGKLQFVNPDDLWEIEKKSERYLEEKAEKESPNLRRIFPKIHSAEFFPFSGVLDRLIGIDQDPGVGRVHDEDGEQIGYGGTPYDVSREILQIIQPRKGDIIYDLGSGLGRFVFYGALTTPAHYRGIELVPERFAGCERIQREKGIDNAEFIHSDVKKQDYGDGDVFFMFNPFSPETLEHVTDTLRVIGERKPIKVVSYHGPCAGNFRNQDWLTPIGDGGYRDFYIGESRPVQTSRSKRTSPTRK